MNERCLVPCLTAAKMNSNSEPNSAKLDFLQKAPVQREIGLCLSLHYRLLLPSHLPLAICVGS